MGLAGHIYGVVLNDREELVRLASAFHESPYASPPRAPVVYMKPASAIARGVTRIRAGQSVRAATTMALLFARDVCRIAPDAVRGHVGASALAIDLSCSTPDYYRPDVAFRNADGFLALGDWGAPSSAQDVTLSIDGQQVHRWSLERLVRPVEQLVADLSSFMTIRAGDALLVGLPGDAPTASAGQTLIAQSSGFAPLSLILEQAP